MKVKDKVAISEHRCKSLSDYNMFIAETCALDNYKNNFYANDIDMKIAI